MYQLKRSHGNPVHARFDVFWIQIWLLQQSKQAWKPGNRPGNRETGLEAFRAALKHSKQLRLFEGPLKVQAIEACQEASEAC